MNLVLLLLTGAVFVWSFVGCHDVFTWALEVAPAVIGGAALIATYNRFRFTTFVYTLIAVHAMVLMVGGHYTYAEVPLFNWVKGAAGLSRNHYDRVGHFMQGFVPAMITREVLLRRSPLQRGPLLTFLVLSVCMAISACYELVEFGVAMATGSAADAFLGSQGDPWDTQWDMFSCLVGATSALLLVTGIQDRQIAKVPAEASRTAGAAR